MVFQGKISPEVRAYVHLLRFQQGLSYRQIAKKVNISSSSAERIAKSPIHHGSKCGVPKNDGNKIGRPKVLSARDERHLQRELTKLQDCGGTFHINDIMINAGVTTEDASVRSVSRHFNKKQYGFYITRKKGLLSKRDLRQRVSFAKKIRKKYPPNFWTDDVAFYLDGVAFVYKTNPAEQARAPGARIWRKRSQGLKRGCTSKGRKEGTGGRYVRLIVAISYGKGIIVCEPYKKMSGGYFASFIRRYFEDMFLDSGKDSSTWVQDGDPSQNSRAAQNAMKDVKANLLSIPPRSPDLNPIENLFNVVHKELSYGALRSDIRKETFEEFEKRVIDTMYSISVDTIDKTIASMDKRLKDIIKSRGCRLKY